jgi:lipopolysaccharide/colanic/teichoic acid biosynthesis glycosyltransferase/glycosyltransferase involved in cell wall biosynthesis
MLVITKGEAGGAQTHVMELCQALQDKVQFTAVIGGPRSHSTLGMALQAIGVNVIALPSLRNSLNPFKVIASVRSLLALIQQSTPLLLHAHSAVAGVIARLAGKLAQRPVIYTVHGFGFKPQAPALIRRNAWLAEALLAAWTTRMICVSAYEQTLAARLPMDTNRIDVIYNAVADVPWRSQQQTDVPSIVMVARMTPPKRHDLLINALALLTKQNLKPITRLLGDGPERPAHQLRASAQSLSHIEWAGDVNNVAEQLAQHQIFVLLSDHEGLPIAIIEAMRSGMAIIATQLPGIAEMIDHGENGLLVENDTTDIANALTQLLQDVHLRQRLGQAARQRYETRFQPEAMAQQVLQIYQEAPLQGTAMLPMTLPRSSAPQLASQHAQRQRQHLGWSMLGIVMIGLAYAISQALETNGLATHDFSRTVLTCIVPYALAAHLIYSGAHMPVAERTGLLMVTTGLPFLLTPLAFALAQQPYSRGAVLLTGGLTLLWFWLGNRWLITHQGFKLLYVDEALPEQMNALLDQNREPSTAPLQHKLQLLRWPEHWQAHPELCPSELDVQGALIGKDSTTCPENNATLERQRLLTQLKLRHIRLYSPQAIAESLTGRLSAQTMASELWQPDNNPAYDLIKRILDLCVVLITAPIWVPLLVLVALAVKIDSPGPAIFSQMRTGLHGQAFRIYKFRSMRHTPIDTAQFAQRNDPRITRIGHFIRKTRLDEIPQLWNVLRGQMSLIGPRPEQETFVQQFAEKIPSYPYRHLVRPGLTGWAQVQQGYAANAQETAIKLSYDLYYVTHYSLAMDLLIAFKTLRVMFNGFGAR